MFTPIQQQRTQCPAGWPSVMSRAWLSALNSSASLISCVPAGSEEATAMVLSPSNCAAGDIGGQDQLEIAHLSNHIRINVALGHKPGRLFRLAVPCASIDGDVEL